MSIFILIRIDVSFIHEVSKLFQSFWNLCSNNSMMGQPIKSGFRSEMFPSNDCTIVSLAMIIWIIQHNPA